MKTSSDPYTLNILFAGICTHFKGVVAGVPHRVVLPDATRISTGFISVVDDTPPMLYYLTPHFPTLAVDSQVDLSVPGQAADLPLIDRGNVRLGVRLQVINSLDCELKYTDFHNTPKLTRFMPDYNFSDDVVLNGRASCYLDVFGGHVTTLKPPPDNPNGPHRVRIQMQTDGPPELLVTPLLPLVTEPDSPPPFKAQRLPLAASGPNKEITLFIKNLEVFAEISAEQGEGSFDYLLHYLTARGGVPLSIKHRTPGMPPKSEPLPSTTPEKIGVALNKLAGLLGAGPAAPAQLPQHFLTPSCSDSQYP